MILIDDLVRRQVDGLIVASVFGRPDLTLRQSSRSTPIVFIDAPGAIPGYASLGTDGSEAPLSRSSIWRGSTTTRRSAWWWAAWTAPARTLASRVGNRPSGRPDSRMGRSPGWTGHVRVVTRVDTAC